MKEPLKEQKRNGCTINEKDVEGVLSKKQKMEEGAKRNLGKKQKSRNIAIGKTQIV